jgi:hypothetical protein
MHVSQCVRVVRRALRWLPCAICAGPTGPSGASTGQNGTFVVGLNTTVNANSGSVVNVNDGAQYVDARSNANLIFNLLGERRRENRAGERSAPSLWRRRKSLRVNRYQGLGSCTA